MTVSPKKSYMIQMLRGFAIIAVVFIHNTPEGLPQVLCRPFLNFSVGLFLFLSGMLSSADKWKPRKRIMKILIPYIIWTLLYVILHTYKEPTQIPLVYIKQLITGKAASVMYYVFIYCELTLLIPMIDKLARSRYKLFGFLISPVEIILMRMIPMATCMDMNKYVSTVMRISCVGWFLYFYLGYLLGNNLLQIKVTTPKLVIALIVSVLLQIAEGYWYYSLGNPNCGTQLKLSSVLTGSIFVILAYQYLESEKGPEMKVIYVLGEYSFGIFFSHLAIMSVLNKIPYYTQVTCYPFTAIIALLLSLCFVMLGRKLLGKHSKYLAL